MKPIYSTPFGRAYCGDSLDVMATLPSASVNLVVTSPPFPLTFRKKPPYNTVAESHFVGWLLPYAREWHRLLVRDGSLVLDVGGVWNKGSPTKSLYQYRLLIALCDQLGFRLAQDFYWYNPAALPAPAEWVNVRRIRVKSAVNLVFWLSKSDVAKANNRNVLRPYSADMIRLITRGYRAKERPSGHSITGKFQKDHGGSIPPNLLEFGNNDSNSIYLRSCAAAGVPVHPARFPRALPEFFIKLCTNACDTVLDPFAGSNVTGEAAERLGRRWLAIEIVEDYLRGSKYRFHSLSTPGAIKKRA
jgi:site-specific DNA-methyltransferase (cytosine-N4-specific)